MVLETLQKGAPGNIRDLAVTVPERPQPIIFDPQRDLDPFLAQESYSWVRKNSNGWGTRRNFHNYLEMRSYMTNILAAQALLFADTPPAIPKNDGLFRYLKREDPPGTIEGSSIWVKIIFPQKEAKDFSRGMRLIAETPLEIPDSMEPWDFEKLALHRLFNPINPQDPLTETKIKDFLSDPNFDREEKLYCAVLSRIILGENPCEITQEDWDFMIQGLEGLQKDYPVYPDKGYTLSGYFKYALSMHILAAEEVRVAANGRLQVIPKSPITSNFQQATPPLPHTRRF